MPWELDYALLSFSQLKKSKYHLNKDDDIFIDVTLNLSNYLFDWSLCKIPKEFFVDKFTALQPLLVDYKCKFIIYDGDDLFGGLNSMWASTEPHIDHYMTLNPDMYFTEHLLYFLIHGSKQVNNKFFIISAQTPKLWDSTWDVLTNKDYDSHLHKDYRDIDVYDVRYNMKSGVLDAQLSPVKGFKFAGWMDLFNKEMWENFMIHSNWTGYGSCDLYAMLLAEYSKVRGVDIQQYVIENQLTVEYDRGPMNISGYNKHYRKYIAIKDILNQRKEFESNMGKYMRMGIKNLIDKNIISPV